MQWAIIATAALLAGACASGAVFLIDRTSSTPSTPSSFTGPPLHFTTIPSPVSSHSSASDPTIRLTVPAAGIDIQVIAGDGIHVPLHLAMHYPGTFWPGEGGGSLFYAHAQRGMFQGLFNVHLGDEIRAVRADGSQLLYQVRAIRRVAYDDDSVLDPRPFEQITLLTCTSYNPDGSRLIVIGTPV